MKADLAGSLKRVKDIWSLFEHNGKPMTKEEVEMALLYGLRKGYKTIDQITNDDIKNSTRYGIEPINQYRIDFDI